MLATQVQQIPYNTAGYALNRQQKCGESAGCLGGRQQMFDGAGGTQTHQVDTALRYISGSNA